ncbi:S9 family peptidase [Dyella psychrodurans]|uniref:S9 family peptidase n=2 Tax=Dyella psychrodurans TaxID=1927960 RepID=A0A370X0V2_9GAMM|nr:S9 family peptidase [Dyella psychrodurans]
MPVVAAAGDRVPVEAFAQRGGYSLPTLSPDGKYLAVAVEQGEDHAVVVFLVSDMTHPKSLLRLPASQLANDIRWVGPERLVVELAKSFGSLDRPVALGEIIASDADGKRILPIFNRDWVDGRGGTQRTADDGYATIASVPPKTNGHFYMQTYMWDDEKDTWLYDVDASTGVRHLIGQINLSNMDFLMDADGNVRYAEGVDISNKHVVYRMQGGRWVQLADEDGDNRFNPVAFSQDKQHLYALTSVKAGPYSLVQTNADGTQPQLLAKDDFGSIGEVQWTPQNEPISAAPATGVPTPIVINGTQPLAQVYQALYAKFPNQFVRFSSFSEDGTVLIFEVGSDRDPGTYYLYDMRAKKIVSLFSASTSIDPEKMGKRVPMHFTASDGMSLEAILTVPKGADMNNLPMVLLPHGGPIGVQDDWFFDTDAQFLASRGYLVLQVNYRGSGSRGPGFSDAGYGQWGTRIQQDLIDGVKWAEAQHFADPKRVCVFGASFGGYSAMMTVVRAPGMFKCAIGEAGIYDLAMMYDKGDIKDTKYGKNYLKQAIGNDPSDLAANSPDKLADKIDVPVLLIHGEADERAPFAQAKAMRAALETAHKPYEWLTKPKEGHGFYKEENLVDMYNHVQAFLEKNIGPGVQAN